MMQGVEILAQEPIIGDGCGWIAFLIGVIITAIVGVVFELYVCDNTGIFIAFLLSFLSVVVGTGVDAATAQPTGEYEYKVTISDKVSMNDFLEKYEIIDQEGKIFTVKERDDTND